MSFTVNLYKVTDDPIVVNKTIPQTSASIVMSPVGDIDELTPYFEVDYSQAYDDINYAYISKFDRYYFVKKILLTKHRYGLQFNVDVLKSNETEIFNLTTTITRTGKLSKPTYVQDSLLPIESNRQFVRAFHFDGTSPHIDNGYVQSHLILQTI